MCLYQVRQLMKIEEDGGSFHIYINIYYITNLSLKEGERKMEASPIYSTEYGTDVDVIQKYPIVTLLL